MFLPKLLCKIEARYCNKYKSDMISNRWLFNWNFKLKKERGYLGNSSWISLILSHHEEHEDH